MKLKFTKMQGLGNDFVVIDAVSQSVSLTPAQLRLLADRHFGIGCDQILLVEKAEGDADFRYRIYNADGGEVEQCGNGARCFVRYVHDRGMTRKNEIRVETVGGLIIPRLETNGEVTVNMGTPKFEPQEIPFIAEKRAMTYVLDVDGRQVEISAVSLGNPHAVQVVADVDCAPVLTEGALIEHHPRFPQRVNAGYMQVLDRAHIRLRVYERGAGETLACGTGACAAVVTGILFGLAPALSVTGPALFGSLHQGSRSIAGSRPSRWMRSGLVVVEVGLAAQEALGAGRQHEGERQRTGGLHRGGNPLGLLVASAGLDNPAGFPRFTFGNAELAGGLTLIPIMIGMFAVSEIIRNVAAMDQPWEMAQAKIGNVFTGMWTLTKRYPLQIVRGCRGLNLVGADLVEVSPPYDPSGNTALLGANLLYEMLCVLPGVTSR